MKSLICVGCFFALFLSIGCDSKPAASSSTTSIPTVTLQLNWHPEPQFGGFYAAQETGAFKKHNLNVNIVPGTVGTPGVQMVGAGKVEFAIVSADEIIIARAGGNNVVGLFAAFQTDPHAIMVHAARGFKSLDDVFANKGTLGLQSGYPYALYLKKKYSFDRLKIVPSPGGDLSSFKADPEFGQQCFITSEPVLAKHQGLDPQSFLIADTGYNPYTTVLATNDEYAKQHPDIVKAMVEACREGWRSYVDNPAAINEVIGKLNPSMDPLTLKDSADAQKPLIENDDTKTNGLGSMTGQRWELLGKQLEEVNIVPKSPPADACYIAVK